MGEQNLSCSYGQESHSIKVFENAFGACLKASRSDFDHFDLVVFVCFCCLVARPDY